MKKKYNVLIITAAHPYKNSGIVAFDLMQSLINEGCNVEIVTNTKLNQKFENTISLKGYAQEVYLRIKNRLMRYTRNSVVSNPNYYMHDLSESKNIKFGKKILKKIKTQPDAILYLFSNHFLTPYDLDYLYVHTKAPVFWYMMDMSPMTGGCHYAWECLGYANECGFCPGIYSDSKEDQTHLNWQNKFNSIKNSNIIPIAASEWQYNQLKISSLFKTCKKYKIYLPIDDALFKPGNKSEARKIFGLADNKRIVFFGAVSVNEIRKGYKELIESFKILKTLLLESKSKDILLVIAGNYNDKMDSDLPFEHQFLGHLDYSKLSTAFQAADVFVCPSIEDSGPMMINQSIMCGTPVVSFEMGVALDLVHNGLTGFRARLKDCYELAIGIKKIVELDKVEAEKMMDNCIKLNEELLKSERISAEFFNMITENIN